MIKRHSIFIPSDASILQPSTIFEPVNTITYAWPVHHPSYDERLEALTMVYLELNLPPREALQAAQADLHQLGAEPYATPAAVALLNC
jgi:hypothetical protein